MTEEELGGGGLTRVVRVGETVRRRTGAWTPAVHALLGHLASVGFDGAPRVKGFDAEGREVLEYVPGEMRDDCDDESLVDVARLIRRFHDATLTFEPPVAARWQSLVGAPSRGDVICHNDLSPANTVWSKRLPRAFIDWDLAAPGPRSWDVAYALYRFVPFYSDDDCKQLGIPKRARRPRVHEFCAAYWIEVTPPLFDVVEARVQALYESARTWGEAGVPGWSDVWTHTRGEQWLRSLRFIRERRTEWGG